MADYPLVTIWPILHYDDTEAALDSHVEVLGFPARVWFEARTLASSRLTSSSRSLADFDGTICSSIPEV